MVCLGIGVRVEALPLQFKKALLQLQTKLSPNQLSLAANTMWSIWKGRNAALIEGVAFNPMSIVHQARAMPVPGCKGSIGHQIKQQERYQVPVTDETILVDASWDHNSCAGLP
jgi:hypothetical protein